MMAALNKRRRDTKHRRKRDRGNQRHNKSCAATSREPVWLPEPERGRKLPALGARALMPTANLIVDFEPPEARENNILIAVQKTNACGFRIRTIKCT